MDGTTECAYYIAEEAEEVLSHHFVSSATVSGGTGLAHLVGKHIVDVGSGNRVVTVIEFLSPANKVPGAGQDLYLRRQREVMAAGASLVEVDLTRSGQRVTVARPGMIPPRYRAAYQACVYRAWKADCVAVHALRLSRPLPAIPVPLRQTDKELKLDLQSLVGTCYRNGRYDTIDYRAEPVPPLSPTDAAWSDELLRIAGRR